MKYVLNAKEFKKMNDPVDKEAGRTKYVCYADVTTIPTDWENWMRTNPREQKMSTSVAKNISESLQENSHFHDLNRGVLLSAQQVSYDNKTHEAAVEFVEYDIHGNIDGGHTLRAIFAYNDQLQKSKAEQMDLFEEEGARSERYVYLEIFTGIQTVDDIVELAAARNTAIQVDNRSLQELQKNFDIIKEILDELDLPFANRIAYKMNEHIDTDLESIDVREIIAITNMFNQLVYRLYNANGLSETQPIQSYTGKEVSLKRYIALKKDVREAELQQMKPILKDIFLLWDKVESDFPVKANMAGRLYGRKKYAKYNKGSTVGKTMFLEQEVSYVVPKGILYPVVGAFRALVDKDQNTGMYSWKKNCNPLEVWEKIGTKLATIVLDEKEENPEYLGKSTNLWSNLLKELVIYEYLLH